MLWMERCPLKIIRNGRHGGVQHLQQKKSEYEIFMKMEKIHLTFTFKGRFSSVILNLLLKVRQIATDDLHLSYVDDNDDDYI